MLQDDRDFIELLFEDFPKGTSQPDEDDDTRAKITVFALFGRTHLIGWAFSEGGLQPFIEGRPPDRDFEVGVYSEVPVQETLEHSGNEIIPTDAGLFIFNQLSTDDGPPPKSEFVLRMENLDAELDRHVGQGKFPSVRFLDLIKVYTLKSKGGQ